MNAWQVLTFLGSVVGAIAAALSVCLERKTGRRHKIVDAFVILAMVTILIAFIAGVITCLRG